MKKDIEFTLKGSVYSIPNSWERLNTYQFKELVADLISMSAGKLSAGLVRVRHICRVMGWDINKITDADAMGNIACLAEQVTFPFLICYPDNDAALADLDTDSYELCKRVPPERLTGITISRYLSRLDYKFVVDSCFCKQFIGSVHIDGQDEPCLGYTIDTGFSMLTTSLTAQQFIDARELADCRDDQLPLLASILYSLLPYESDKAHQRAVIFSKVDIKTLQAIRFNFKGFINYLFSRTEYKILTKIIPGKESVISTGAQDALYGLSADGYGNLREISQMSVLQYLGILRKKMIESVRSLHASKMDVAEIANTTRLPIDVINDIL